MLIIDRFENPKLILDNIKVDTPDEKIKFYSEETRNFFTEIKLSLPIQTFKHRGVKCITCGIEADIVTMYRQRRKSKNCYSLLFHFKDICKNTNKMTVDHLIPKSWTNCNNMHNLFPMCEKCNSAKANFIPPTSIPYLVKSCMEKYKINTKGLSVHLNISEKTIHNYLKSKTMPRYEIIFEMQKLLQ